MPDLDLENLPDSKIRYSFAKTDDGELISIENAAKKTKYNCWGCNSPMYKRGGPRRTDHFYHIGDTCPTESALHEAFKCTLHKLIFDGIRNNEDTSKERIKLIIQWVCKQCNITQDLDLLEIIADAKKEVYINKYKPDISLYRKDGSIYTVIEVEYKHPLDDNPRKYYSENNIGIIEFILENEKDLDRIKADPLKPDTCNMCPHVALEENNSNIVLFNGNQQRESQANEIWCWLMGFIAFVVIAFLAFILPKLFKKKRAYYPKRKPKKIC
jgi:hypothetical protein